MNDRDEKTIIKLRDKLLREYRKEKKASAIITSKMILSFYEKNKPDAKNMFYVEDIYNVSTVYMKYNMYDLASRYFKEVMDFCEKNTPENKTLISIYNNLGICYSNLSRHALALDMYKKTLEMQFDATPDDKSSIAGTLCNIGTACYDMCDYENALRYHMEALNYRNKKIPDLTVADNYNYIAYDYEACSQQTKACEYAQKAIDTIKNSKYPDPNELMSNYYYIAGLYEKMKNYSESIDAYEEAIANIKKIAGEKNPFYAQILLKLSDVYLYVNKPEKALTLRMKSLGIIGESMGENHIYYANSLKGIAYIYLLLHNYEKALSYTLRELEIKGNILNKNCDDYLRTALKVCGIYELLGEREKAKQELTALISHSDNTESKYYMDILYYLGRLYIDDSDNERIYELYNTSVITRSDISANEFIENCYNAKDNMHELLYDDETNIHIGKSMDISIEKSVEVDMNELSLNEFDELEESEEDEENENGSDYYSNLLDDLKSAFDFDDDSFDPENDDFDDEDDED